MDRRRTAVVDDRQNVRSIEGLRVIDVAVMPTIALRQYQCATAMIAEQGARFVLEETRIPRMRNRPTPLP